LASISGERSTGERDLRPDDSGIVVLVGNLHRSVEVEPGSDLRHYVSFEFGEVEWTAAIEGRPRRIRFWSELVEANG
jgi:hypothetical protein